MNSPHRLFHAMWKEKLSGSDQRGYRPGENQRVDAAARLLAGGERLLDVGCGAGVLALAVKGKFREVFGVDVAQPAIEAARRNGVVASRVDLNSEPLPFDAEFFDAVTFLSVIPYVYDPYHALRECHRVLRRGGMLCVSAANMRTVGKLCKLLLKGRFPTTSKGIAIGYDGGAMHYFCSGDLSDLLNKTGFSQVNKRGIFYWPQCLRVTQKSSWLRHISSEFLAGEVLLSAEKASSEVG